MPVSRIPFALHDAIAEIKALAGDHERADFAVNIQMDQRTYDGVVDELQHHHGAKLKRDERHRGLGKAVLYGGMRLVCVPPGNRNG